MPTVAGRSTMRRRPSARSRPMGWSTPSSPVRPSRNCVSADRLARNGIRRLVAADESIRKASDPIEVARRDAADLVVVKVAPLGGVRAALAIVEACGLPAVVSSALDTCVGMAAGVALASALPDRACGLGTVNLLVGDVVRDSRVPRHGVLTPGAVRPDGDLLDRWQAPSERVRWWHERVRECWELLACSRCVPTRCTRYSTCSAGWVRIRACWVAGCGRPARAREPGEHRDLDLAVVADLVGEAVRALVEIGFAVTTDWLPVRVELADAKERVVDLHPLHFTPMTVVRGRQGWRGPGTTTRPMNGRSAWSAGDPSGASASRGSGRPMPATRRARWTYMTWPCSTSSKRVGRDRRALEVSARRRSGSLRMLARRKQQFPPAQRCWIQPGRWALLG